MGKDLTVQNGYFRLTTPEGGQWLHFSINAWYNLKNDTGKSVSEFFGGYNKLDQFDQLFAVCDLVYAAAKAYDQEEGNDIDYNITEVREWVNLITEEETVGLLEAMAYNANTVEEGKKKAKKKG